MKANINTKASAYYTMERATNDFMLCKDHEVDSRHVYRAEMCEIRWWSYNKID